MANGLYLRFDDNNINAHILTVIIIMIEGKWISWMHTTPYIAWKMIEKIYLVLDTHSTERNWRAF